MSEETQWVPPPFGSPCWVEIPAADVTACKEFYSKLFPSWTWTPSTDRHPEDKLALYKFGTADGLGGGIVKVPVECKASGGELKKGVGVTIYHLVESIEETKKRVEELGGVAVTEKEPESDSGWHMHFKDTEGNRFGIYQLKK
ncbi:hypothetical protein OIDMADRAFT_181574 [Oidiodendron maius Zn]|uniref:Uncharacterized protein n=1 Tax=Oidiodendron maius (strain Zn) TaxID=913774 RepID=A0A0C3GT31_OIDMZ|nr:hypothetical protein OIDMADRAFT_181574 [Oidiodendron maius Zn]